MLCRAQPHQSAAASLSVGSATCPSRKAGLVEESRDDDGPRRMYSGHDMSSHEVVVRSLLEVLQEFTEAGEGDRTVRLRTVLVENRGFRRFCVFEAERFCSLRRHLKIGAHFQARVLASPCPVRRLEVSKRNELRTEARTEELSCYSSPSFQPTHTIDDNCKCPPARVPSYW